MLTVIIKRSVEPEAIHFTIEDIVRQMSSLRDCEILVEDSWREGLRKVRTPYVCLVEGDCTLSASYLVNNIALMKKAINWGTTGGGYVKLAMLSSCLSYKTFDNRIYNYGLSEITTYIDKSKDWTMTEWGIGLNRNKGSSKLYPVQVGFVPGAIIRTSAINREAFENINWDNKNLIQLSTEVSFHFWNTNRRVQVNPNTTYVSLEEYLLLPSLFKLKVPDKVANIFQKEGIT